jgi:hypothetical protein
MLLEEIRESNRIFDGGLIFFSRIGLSFAKTMKGDEDMLRG